MDAYDFVTKPYLTIVLTMQSGKAGINVDQLCLKHIRCVENGVVGVGTTGVGVRVEPAGMLMERGIMGRMAAMVLENMGWEWGQYWRNELELGREGMLLEVVLIQTRIG